MHNSTTVLFAFFESIEHNIFHLPFCPYTTKWATLNDANYFENINKIGDFVRPGSKTNGNKNEFLAENISVYTGAN